MDSEVTHSPAGDGTVTVDVFKVIARNQRMIVRTVAVATLIVAAFGGLYYMWLQPRRTIVTLHFRPTFDGAKEGEYPNKLKFGPSDVVASTVVTKVYESNALQGYCPYQAFASSLYVDASSPAARMLEHDYAARLGDARLTQPDRERLQAEYRERLEGLEQQFRVSYMQSAECAELPHEVASKALGQLLEVWAQEADQRRGVLKMRVSVLTPNVLAVQFPADGSRLIRAELIRAALVKVIANVREVEELPGAELIHLEGGERSFVEVRTRLEELVRARLEPVIPATGESRSGDAFRWVQESLEATLVNQRAAEQRANAYLTALREYSGIQGMAPTAGEPGGRSGPTSDVQALTPQIDRTFIDRIVELSEPNAEFRQELSREMVERTLEAVNYDAESHHFRRLLAVLASGREEPLPTVEVDSRLNGIVSEGKVLIQRFNELYREFSSVSLRSAPQMYVLDGGATVTTIEPFDRRELILLVTVTLLLSLFAAVIAALVRARFALA